MINIPKPFLALIVTLSAGSLFLSACGPGALLAAPPEPTLIPTVTGSGAVTVEGRLVPNQASDLSFPAPGEIAALPVAEGEEVAAGTILARLGKREPLEAALSAARLEELSAQQALDDLNEKAGLTRMQAEQTLAQARRAAIDAQQALVDLDTDAFQDQLDDENTAVEDALNELNDARENLDQYLDRDPDDAARTSAQDELDAAQDAYDEAVRERDRLQNQLDQARAALNLANAALDDAQRNVGDLQDGPDPDLLALAQARLDNAEAQVAAAQRTLENMDLTAPYDGVIANLYDLEPGESVLPGQPVVTLADFSAWYVETRDLTELEVVDVQVGQTVTIVPDALPDLELTGEVESIDQAFLERSGDVLYTVRIRLDDTDERLRWGMTVTATFEE